MEIHCRIAKRDAVLQEYNALLTKPPAHWYGQVKWLCEQHHIPPSTLQTWWLRRRQPPSCAGQPSCISATEQLALRAFVDAAAGEGRIFGELKAEVTRITEGRIDFSHSKDHKWLSVYVISMGMLY